MDGQIYPKIDRAVEVCEYTIHIFVVPFFYYIGTILYAEKNSVRVQYRAQPVLNTEHVIRLSVQKWCRVPAGNVRVVQTQNTVG
jgi:hypothetical protein